jgi:hypothetical protein
MKKEILIALITGVFIIGGAVLSSPHWFKYLFPEQYLEQEQIIPIETSKKDIESKIESMDEDETSKSGTENLVISKIEISPKVFNLPSYFYIEIENKGTRTIENLEVLIDLGRAKYEDYDYSKSLEIIPLNDTNDMSFLKFKISLIKPNQSIQIYSLQSIPVFRSIVMNASNMTFDKVYSYEEYLKSEDGSYIESSSFESFLWIMFSLVIIVFTIYFVIVGIAILNRLFKIE